MPAPRDRPRVRPPGRHSQRLGAGRGRVNGTKSQLPRAGVLPRIVRVGAHRGSIPPCFRTEEEPHMNRQPSLTVLTCLALSCAAIAPQARAAGDWEWSLAPYFWLTGMDVDAETELPPSGGTETRFDDMIDNLDGVFQGHVEGRTDHWGAFADFTFIGFADEQERTFFRTESDFDARLFELALFWSPDSDRDSGLDVFAGLRRIDL